MRVAPDGSVTLKTRGQTNFDSAVQVTDVLVGGDECERAMGRDWIEERTFHDVPYYHCPPHCPCGDCEAKRAEGGGGPCGCHIGCMTDPNTPGEAAGHWEDE